jgi:hypothetical protein
VWPDDARDVDSITAVHAICSSPIVEMKGRGTSRLIKPASIMYRTSVPRARAWSFMILRELIRRSRPAAPTE